jgi:hypothetical protein
MKAQYTLLIALIVACLVPYGWVAQQSPVLDLLFNVVFHAQVAHTLGHSAIFAVIGLALIQIIPTLRTRPVAYVALILLAGLGQEGFQTIYKGQLYLPDTLGDLLTDLVAAAGVWVLVSRQAARAQTEGAA